MSDVFGHPRVRMPTADWESKSTESCYISPVSHFLTLAIQDYSSTLVSVLMVEYLEGKKTQVLLHLN